MAEQEKRQRKKRRSVHDVLFSSYLSLVLQSVLGREIPAADDSVATKTSWSSSPLASALQ